MITKDELIRILTDIVACKEQIEYLKEDPRDLDDIFHDPTIRDKNFNSIPYDLTRPNLHYLKKIYDINWIYDGPCANFHSSYDFEETIEILEQEHKLWKEDYEQWVKNGGLGNLITPDIEVKEK